MEEFYMRETVNKVSTAFYFYSKFIIYFEHTDLLSTSRYQDAFVWLTTARCMVELSCQQTRCMLRS